MMCDVLIHLRGMTILCRGLDSPLSVSVFLGKKTKQMYHVTAGLQQTLMFYCKKMICAEQNPGPCEQDDALCGTNLQSWGLA